MNIFSNLEGGVQNVNFNGQHVRNIVREYTNDKLGVNDVQAGLNLFIA